MGKSPWLHALQVNLSTQYGWKHAQFSPESYPTAMHYNSLIELVQGNSQDMLTDDLYTEGIEFVDEHFNFIYPPEDNCTVDALLEIFGRVHDNFGCDTITIDPWNEIEHRRPNWMSETEYISFALSKIRRFCRDREIHGFLVVHPTKPQKDKNGDYPVPNPYDAAGSAHFRNKLDFCICVHRPNIGKHGLDDYTQVHVQKVKMKNLGKLGCAELSYDWRSGRYAERGSKHFTLPRRCQ
jgi:twinkle protein